MQLDAFIQQLPEIKSCKAAANACSNNSYFRFISFCQPMGAFREDMELCQDPLRSQKKTECEGKGSCKPKG